MNKQAIITSATTGILCMSLFSYVLSIRKNKQFKEPEILGILINRLLDRKNRTLSHIGGWAIHYFVGLLFTTTYDMIWKSTRVKPVLSHSIALGAFSGLVGILGWNVTLRVHPRPPKIDIKRFFFQLLIAHIIFAVFAAEGYKLIEKDNKKALQG